MAMTDNHDRLRQQVDKQVDRIKKAQRERSTLLAQTAYLGTAGVLFVLPIVAGAYLGRWLDGLIEGYSIRWTVSLILIGIAVGGVNVYLFFRE